MTDSTNECVQCGAVPRRKGYTRCSKCVYQNSKEKVQKWREENPERVKELSRRSERRRWGPARQNAIAYLGGQCARCGFSDERALDIDHIDGGGTRERVRKNRITFYKEIAEGKRDDVQLLCLNCHRIKSCEESLIVH